MSPFLIISCNCFLAAAVTAHFPRPTTHTVERKKKRTCHADPHFAG